MYRFFFIIFLFINFCSWSMEEIPAIKIEEQENNTFEMVKKFLNSHKDKIQLRGDDKEENREDLVNSYIEDLVSYSCVLEKHGINLPLTLMEQDFSYFENLHTSDMIWNSQKNKESNLNILKFLAQNFIKHSIHTGGCGLFDEFTLIQKSNSANYILHQTDRALLPEELDELAKKYRPPFVYSKKISKLEQSYRYNRDIKPNEEGLIELDGKKYIRKLHVNGKFLDIPNDWDSRQTNLFMSMPCSNFPLSEQFKEQNVDKIIKLQNIIHLARQNEYHQQQGNKIKTINLIWPTGTIVPRYIVLDPFYISWIALFRSNPSAQFLSFVVLNDNLELARKIGVYRTTKEESKRDQVLIVELSYTNELEISAEKFREMEKKFVFETQAFWDTTNLAGINLSSIDLLIVVQENGDRFYLPRHISNQVLPSYLVEIKIEKPASEVSIISSIKKSVSYLIGYFEKLKI